MGIMGYIPYYGAGCMASITPIESFKGNLRSHSTPIEPLLKGTLFQPSPKPYSLNLKLINPKPLNPKPY